MFFGDVMQNYTHKIFSVSEIIINKKIILLSSSWLNKIKEIVKANYFPSFQKEFSANRKRYGLYYR
jgi:hypothetical protein